MTVEMDMNYPSDAVDAIMSHRYEGLPPVEACRSRYGRTDLPSSLPSGRNFDYPIPYEGAMMKSQLWAAEQDARALRQLLEDTDDLPGWTLTQVATAADRLNTTSKYLRHKIESRAAGMSGLPHNQQAASFMLNHRYGGW